MLRYLLVFLAGALLGANVAYYYASSRVSVGPVTRGVDPQTGQPAKRPADAGNMPAPPTPGTAGPSQRPVEASPAARAAVAASGLVVPVQGVRPEQLVDTYTQSRGTGRLHEAIDIMAPAGTPVVAAVDGTVARVFTSERGGLTVYQFDRDQRHVYYYAHLQGYAPGITEGKTLRRGEVLGYVGSTGSADPGAPHLHFSIGELTPEKQWSRSVPMNPYPMLTGAR